MAAILDSILKPSGVEASRNSKSFQLLILS